MTAAVDRRSPGRPDARLHLAPGLPPRPRGLPPRARTDSGAPGLAFCRPYSRVAPCRRPLRFRRRRRFGPHRQGRGRRPKGVPQRLPPPWLPLGRCRPPGFSLRRRCVPADPYIRCPYHQWAYRLDGSLAACGGMDRMEGFDPAANGLCPLDCAEVGGLVFVRFEPPAPASRPPAGPSPRFTSWPSPYYRKAWKRQSGLFADVSGRRGLESGVGEQP